MSAHSRLSYWLLAGLLLSVTPLFFVSVTGDLLRRIPPELYAFGHVGMFGVVSVLLMTTPALGARPFWQRAWLTLGCVLLLGGALELLQPLAGRSASLLDIWQNIVGAVAGIALLAPARRRAALLFTAAVLLTVTLQAPAIGLWDRAVARQQFPVLSDFDSRFDHRRWTTGTPDERVARIGQRSLRLDLEPGRYSGTLRRRSLGDWSDYSALELGLYLAGETAITMTLSVRDQAHFRRGGHYSDRFNQSVRLDPGWNTITVPIATIRTAPETRELALDDLAELVLFTGALQQPRTVYLDSVRLIR